MKTRSTGSGWYEFGRWVEPVLSASVFLELNYKEFDMNFMKDIRSIGCSYYIKNSDLEECYHFVKNKIENDQKWFDKFFSIVEKRVNALIKYEKKKDLNNFLKIMARTLDGVMGVQYIDFSLIKYIEEMHKKTGILPSEIISKINPYKKYPLMIYQEELKTLKEKDIPSFVKKYGWVGTHLFMNTGLTEKKVLEEKSNLPKDKKTSEDIKIPKGYEFIMELGSKLAYYRSYIIDTSNIVAYGYWPIIKKLGKKHGLSWDEIRLLTHQEIIDLNTKGKLPKSFKKRERRYGVIRKNNKTIAITGKELEREIEKCKGTINNNINELKGMVACQGKTILGIARVIEEATNIYRLKKGEILIANETTPDYLIGMKIAGAIVINQGGVTSHASIVSRELKIPCIIGTKIATKLFKDGDILEVDTNKGIVRKIHEDNILLEKVYTRDTSLITQEAWSYGFKKGLKEAFGWDNPYTFHTLYYMCDGTIELWENRACKRWVMDKFLDANKNNKDWILRSLKEYNILISWLEKKWKKGYASNLNELSLFFKKFCEAAPYFIAFYYPAVDDRTPLHIRKKVMEIRKNDAFYENNDKYIRNSLKRILPNIAGVESAVTEEELTKGIPSLDILKERTKHFVMIPPFNYSNITLEEFEKNHPEYKFIREEGKFSRGALKGQPASPGKAKGRVRVLKKKADVKSLVKGEVLISPMTTPDFMPAMKKAAAIITDEGGITCHAAIVTRELNKPCIIGTKVATKVFKTGDYLEVDANKGIIKKIK
jgi:phosphohistidine swiveling domain-containing protein